VLQAPELPLVSAATSVQIAEPLRLARDARKEPTANSERQRGLILLRTAKRNDRFALPRYGYRLHAAVCTVTGLPLAWEVKTAREHESLSVPALFDTLHARGLAPKTAALDMGYDVNPVYHACHERDVLPIIPLRKTAAVKRGEHGAPTCEHGTWTFAGADFKRNAAKWRCPTGECQPKSKWVKAERRYPLIPRQSKRWGNLYRGRAAVEREFGRLKNEYGLTPLRVRGLERVALHADLVMLARLSLALARARAVPLAA
jgi:hypothetical protein